MISGIRHVHMRLSSVQYANKNQSFWELTQFESHCYGVLDMWIRVIHKRMNFQDLESLEVDWNDGQRFVQEYVYTCTSRMMKYFEFFETITL